MGEKKQKTCFIVCPISEKGTETRDRSDQLLEYLLEPVCKELGFEVIRIDKLPHNNSITNEIFKFLNEADLVIGDTTDDNPNCFYEIGYRTALQKPIILVRENGSKLPFDVAGINTYIYQLNDLRAVSDFKDKLKSTISTLSFEVTKNTKDNTNSDEVLNKILQLLLGLDNKLDLITLENKGHNKNIASFTAIISSLIQKATNNQPKTEEDYVLSVFKEAIKNPDNFSKIMAMVEAQNKK